MNPTRYFGVTPEEILEYRICDHWSFEKWLKDRRGKKLSFDDLMHYQKVIVALKETICLIEEIDKAIPGWPME